MIKILPQEIDPWIQYVYSLTGISLDATKGYLLETRLVGLLQETGCATFSELLSKVRTDVSHALRRKVIDAMTTGETLFFRDTAPFEMLQFKILPDLIDARTRAAGQSSRPIPIRIWSAACSTGQEVFSVGIVLAELLGRDLSKYDIHLLGTDISDAAVAHASRGYYQRVEIERGLPREKLLRYFTPSGDSWKIHDEIRAMATFRTMNLFDSYALLGKFDIVLCRNVAIYFKDQDKQKLFNQIAGVLERDGYLIIGSTETLTGVMTRFEAKRYLRSVFYQMR